MSELLKQPNQTWNGTSFERATIEVVWKTKI